MKDTLPDIPFRTAGVTTMLAQCRKVESHMAGVRSGQDTEELRRMRVATRRLRAAMKVFRECFSPRRYERWYSRVSELTDALGLARDIDVQIAAVVRRREGLPPEYQHEVDRWVEAQQARCNEARSHLLETLDQWEEKGLSERLQRVIETTGGLEAPISKRALEVEAVLLGEPEQGCSVPASEGKIDG